MAFSLVLLRVVVLACMSGFLVLNRTILAIVYAPGVLQSNAFGFASMAALQSPPLRNDGAAIALRRAAVAATATLRCCRSAAFPPTTPNCLRTLYTAYLASHTGTPGPARPRLKVAR